MVFIKKTATDPKRSLLVILDASAKVNLLISANGSDWGTYTHATALAAGRWYHAGITYDASDDSYRIRLYDYTAAATVGVDKTGTATDILIVDANFLLSDTAAAQSLDGKLDEVVVFKDVLNVSEIDAIRAGTFSGFIHDAAVVEAASASEIQDALIVAIATIAESTDVADLQDATGTWHVTITESTSVEDSQDALIVAVAAIAESTTVADSQDADTGEIDAAIAESTTVEDTQDVAADWQVGITESTTVADAQDVAVDWQVGITESTTVVDTQDALIVAIATIVESTDVADSQDFIDTLCHKIGSTSGQLTRKHVTDLGKNIAVEGSVEVHENMYANRFYQEENGGWTGTFTNADADTVTVKGGIIVSVA